jgi:hypothetical protein
MTVIIDDLGYLQQSRDDMEVVFALLAERYERGSDLMTSNLAFSKWESFFKDAIDGGSYRPLGTPPAAHLWLSHFRGAVHWAIRRRTDRRARMALQAARAVRGVLSVVNVCAGAAGVGVQHRFGPGPAGPGGFPGRWPELRLVAPCSNRSPFFNP